MGKLEHKVAIVTGGQRGLGAAIVRELVGEGARCYFFFPPADAQEASDFADGLGNGARRCAIRADVRKPDEVAAGVEEVVRQCGRLDILVNNAGVNSLGTWDTIDNESWDLTLSVNLTGVFNCCKAVLPVMKGQMGGNIVNIASVSAFIGRGNADYIASKSALLGLTRSLARQHGKYGIRANCISPGFHNTEMTRRARAGAAENADEFISQVPLGFLAEADSIGKAAAFLVSDDAYYITGHNLVVDGGLTLR